ncbi:hypothetical protein [Paenibacillus sp. FSL L8-0158]|uniref:hypothetical protein n=1 Tax=Paenibacillus sp. FSL L8-0158 TaxID=2954752 RepID=UPI003158AF70
MTEKIVIDSLPDLVDFIINNDLSEKSKSDLRKLENTSGLHLSLGMYIRNRYELSNSEIVPRLIKEYLEIETKGKIDVADDEISIKMLEMFLLNDDDISGSIIKLIWRKLKNEKNNK